MAGDDLTADERRREEQHERENGQRHHLRPERPADVVGEPLVLAEQRRSSLLAGQCLDAPVEGIDVGAVRKVHEQGAVRRRLGQGGEPGAPAA